MELEDVRIILSKDYEVVIKAWTKAEVENKRTISLRLDKETGVYIAMSHPNKCSKETLCKVQNCLAKENMLVIETKDVDILQQWLKEDEEGRNVATNFNAETGVYTAVSTPKTDGNGGVKIIGK